MPNTEPNIAVFEEIKEILAANGSIDQSTKDRMLMTAMLCIMSEVQSVKRRLDQRNNRVWRYVDGAIGALIALGVTYVWLKVTGAAP